jgi:hypothetical protein
LIFFLLSHPILHATYLCHFGNFNFVKYSVPLPPPLSSSFFLPPSPSSLLLLLLLFLLPLRWKIPYVLFCYVAMYWRGAIKIHKKLLTHKTQKNHCASWDRFLPLTIFRPSHLFPEKILYRVLQLKNSARHSRQWLDKTTNVLSNHWRAIFFDFRTRYRRYESIQYDCRPVLHTTVRPRLIVLPSPVYNQHANCCSRRRGWLLRLLPLFNLRTRLREKIRSCLLGTNFVCFNNCWIFQLLSKLVQVVLNIWLQTP